MAKVTIVLTDQENGTVRIDCTPTFPVLTRMHKDGGETPAQGYGLIAAAAVVKTSIAEATKKMKAKMKNENHGALILPDSPRFVGHA